MRAPRLGPASLALLLVAAAPARGQDRPGEQELSGSPADEEQRLKQRLGETDNPLQLGGLLYVRSNLFASESGPPSHWILDAPSLVDVYLDARPDDRLRGFLLARTFYDATLPSGGAQAQPSSSALLAGVATGANPQAVLDQMWLAFDVGRVAFFTVGRQHVKWGVAHFWNPTDFLHTVRRNPLAPFDDRAGTTMVKLALPWERRGWNLYAFAIAEQLVTVPQPFPLPASVPPSLQPQLSDSPFEPASGRSSSELGAVGGAVRGEVVLGGTEIGLGALAQRGVKPRLAADLSTGIWEIDLRGEAAVRWSPDVPRVRERPLPPGDTSPFDAYQRYEPTGPRTAAVLSADWSHKYSDEDSFTVGAEYFFNESGYDRTALYPVLLASNLFVPFYTGRHYAGAFLLLPRPGSWDLHTFTLSSVANLSDRTAVVRLDWSYVLRTHATLEAYVQGHLGRAGGEFRFATDFMGLVHVPPPVADVGLNLRLSL